jgi:hypothetical protein
MELRVEIAGAADDAAIRGMCRREAMPGRIRVTFEREPDFSLGCAVTGEDCQILVARAGREAEVAGVACRSTRRMYVNGREQRLGYLSQLRIGRKFQGRWLVSRGFRLLRQMHESDPVPAYLAAIVEGNEMAAGVLIRNRRRRFPAFHPVAELRTLGMFVPNGKRTLRRDAGISAGREFDFDEIAAFLREHGARRQFFPVWREELLRRLAFLGLRFEDFRIARRNGRITGVAALWDQSAYKQTVVQGYSGWLKAAAPIYNWSAPWLGRPALPRPGEKLRSAYAALVCVAEDDQAVFTALMRELHDLAGMRGFSYLLLGMDARDPLLAPARRFQHIAYPSRLYSVEWPEGEKIHEQLDDRPIYADIAAL